MLLRNIPCHQGGTRCLRHHYCTLKACGDNSVATTMLRLEILNFRQFYKHIVFTGDGDKIRNKEIRDYINVSVVIDLVSGNTTNKN